MPNFMELLKESSMKHWAVSGPERLVKVVSPKGQKDLLGYQTAKGYVTQEKFLLGKTSDQIEKALGLRPLELGSFCYVYSLARLPEYDEVEFKLTCAFPDGKVYDDAHHAKAMTARQNFLDHKDLYDRSQTPVVNYYPPGSNEILQWQLVKPIPLGGLIAMVTKTIPL